MNIYRNLFVLTLIALMVCLYFLFNKVAINPSATGTTSSTFKDQGGPLTADTINCEFKVTSTFIYQNKKDSWSKEGRTVNYEVSSNNNSSLLTFTGLTTNNPKLKGNLDEVQLTILKNDNESIVLAETNGASDIFLYTVYKKEKIATWYKSYMLLNSPFGLLSMGYCY